MTSSPNVTDAHETVVTAGTVIALLHRAPNIKAVSQSVIDELEVHDLPAARRSRRIALVTETYPPEVNGVAMSMARLVEGLHALDHDLQLVRPRPADGAVPREAQRLEQVLTGAWPIPTYPNLRMGVPSRRALVRLWSLRRPDVVHIATEGPLGWSALQAALHLKLPVTSDFRTNFHAYGHHYRLGWLAQPIMAYLRKFHNRADSTMVPTEALRHQLEARGFERLHVVSRGVDTHLFDPAHRSAALRRQWEAGDDDVVMAYVGRLAPEKNLNLVVRAFERVHARLPGARLVFVGDGPMRADLAVRCPAALFAGQRHGADLAAHYASADLFAFPSLTETFGNVTVEAMASGLPVVAFDCAAAAQTIRDGESGRLVASGDEDGFAATTLELACDANTRAALGAAARVQALRHDWAGVVRRFEAVLVRAIDRDARLVTLTTPAHAALH
jgi:glycosyltransferase involved in cell wall biosynthesis